MEGSKLASSQQGDSLLREVNLAESGTEPTGLPSSASTPDMPGKTTRTSSRNQILTILTVFLASAAIVYSPALTQWASVLSSGPAGLAVITSKLGFALSAALSSGIIGSIAYTMFLTNMVLFFFPVFELILKEVFGIKSPKVPVQEGEETFFMWFFGFVAVAMVVWAAFGSGAINIDDQLKSARYVLATVTFMAATLNSIAFNKPPFQLFAQFAGYIFSNIPGLSHIGRFLNYLVNAVSNFISPLTSKLASIKNWFKSTDSNKKLSYGGKLFWFAVVFAAALILTIGFSAGVMTASTQFFSAPGGGLSLMLGSQVTLLNPTTWAWAPFLITVGMAFSTFVMKMMKMYRLIFKIEKSNEEESVFNLARFMQNATKAQWSIAILGTLSAVANGFGSYVFSHAMLVEMGYSIPQVHMIAFASTIAIGALYAGIVPLILQVLNVHWGKLLSQHVDWIKGRGEPDWGEIVKVPDNVAGAGLGIEPSMNVVVMLRELRSC